MSRIGKLSAAALLALVSATALTTNANAFQPRKHCDLLNWWPCSTHVTESQVFSRSKVRPSSVPTTHMDYTDPRFNQAMTDAGGGGGGGGGGR